MRRRSLLALAGLPLVGWAAPALGQEKKPRLAIVGGELHRTGEAALKDAVVVIEGGKIASIGTDEAAAAGATRIEARGKIVTAGLCDPVTRVGISEIELEDSAHDDTLQAGRMVAAAFAAADGYDPASPLVAITRKEGVTSVGAVPGGALVAGQSAWADLAGDTAAEALAATSLALHVLINDYALGSAAPNSATALYFLREVFDDARAFKADKAGYDRRQVRKLAASRRDLEVAARVLDGKLPVVLHADRAADLLNLLALAREYKLNAVLASAAEGWKVAKQIAAAKVPCIVYPLDNGPRDFAALGAREDNAALLAKAGVTVALSSGESHNARKLRQIAGNAVRAGMPHDAALDAVTDAPARIFGMAGYGSPKVGRVANLAVWSGDPFELSSRVEALVIRGAQVSLRSRQTALLERYR